MSVPKETGIQKRVPNTHMHRVSEYEGVRAKREIERERKKSEQIHNMQLMNTRLKQSCRERGGDRYVRACIARVRMCTYQMLSSPELSTMLVRPVMAILLASVCETDRKTVLP